MTKLFALIISAGLILFSPAVSHAATPAELLESLQTVRGHLVSLLGAEKDAQAALVEKIKEATKDVDAKLTALLADAKTSADLKTKLTEVKSTWADFKKTRDEEIIPAVLGGDAEKGKALAKGIQAERFKKMTGLLQ